jgi:malonyl CoA-acyl carrier protein transacylase
MKPVYVFPGQGSQRKGMGEGLFARFRDQVSQADACLGYSIEELCLQDPRKVLGRTEYTQPALYVVNVLSYLDRIASGGEAPGFVAGHSLGEYCALHVAGAFDFVTGLRLVVRRGELMRDAPRGAMAAVVNLDLERVREILARLPYRNIDLANLNARQQCVLSGVYDELGAADVREAFVAAGGSFIPLNVSAAFHSRCMTGVADEFARFLAGFALQPLRIPVIANYTARPYPTTGYADHLVKQIGSSVRWYESMSWLIHQGHREVHEIGPGNVLTKLRDKIAADPMVIRDPPAPAIAAPPAARTPSTPRTKLIFMYGGQGTQYPRMGRGLYDTHPAFRAAMDRCDQAYQALCGTSLLTAIYDDGGPHKPLEDIRYSHAALFAMGYSLTEALRAEGFAPDGVLGHSLGEYIAATIAGAMSFADGLALVVAQARLIAQHGRGGMLSVLAPPALFDDRRDVFEGVALAGVNFAGNFVVSGEGDRLTAVQAALDRLGVIAVRLPVRCGFHSHLVDGMRGALVAHADAITPSAPTLPIYSSARAARLAPAALDDWAGYLWDVVRGPIRFDALIAGAFADPGDTYFVDLSASGSFANFLKHGYGPAYRCAPAINQFGNNTASLARLCRELHAVTAP